jgi:hypothetical protein
VNHYITGNRADETCSSKVKSQESSGFCRIYDPDVTAPRLERCCYHRAFLYFFIRIGTMRTAASAADFILDLVFPPPFFYSFFFGTGLSAVRTMWQASDDHIFLRNMKHSCRT